jgi:hypothetical protein
MDFLEYQKEVVLAPNFRKKKPEVEFFSIT